MLRISTKKPKEAPLPPEEDVPVEEPTPEPETPPLIPEEDPAEPLAKPEGDYTLPKAMVVYMPSEFGPFRCDNCCNFQPDGSCRMVEGPIDPGGCCNIYCPPNHEDEPGMQSSPDEEEAMQGEGDMPEATEVIPEEEAQ